MIDIIFCHKYSHSTEKTAPCEQRNKNKLLVWRNPADLKMWPNPELFLQIVKEGFYRFLFERQQVSAPQFHQIV